MRLIIKTILFSLVCSFTFAAISVGDYYSNITKAALAKNWRDVIYYSKILNTQYPKSSFSQDVTFYLAEAYFQTNELIKANENFSKYLSEEFSPKFYEKAILYKFQIAKKFYEGAKKHLLGVKKLPKMLSGKEDALVIFDEVIKALPNDEICAESLFYKGKIQAASEDFKESIETFQSLIRKFPKHELAVESFLEIEKVYFTQADPKKQDPDLLDMAEVNLKKFREAFPKEERTMLAEKDLLQIKEKYAEGLFKIGEFYERTKKPEASIIYYKKIISSFPQTMKAALSQKRLDVLTKK